jgi:hypothetical protein
LVCGPYSAAPPLYQWGWANCQNPAAYRISPGVARAGTVASQYAGMPMLYDTPWGTQPFIHCVDSMTHPKWRQGLRAKSVFVATGMSFWAHSEAVGDALLYGFPVDAAYRIGKRFFEYVMMRIVDFLIRDANVGPLPAPAGVAVERVDAIPTDVGGLYSEARQDKQCWLRRDHAFLDWRYVANPSRADYELWTARRSARLVGLMVLKPGSGLAPDAATIVDWLVPEHDDEAQGALLAAAVRRQGEEQKQRLMTVFPPWSKEHARLVAAGFELVPSATWLQRRLIQHIGVDAITPEFLAEQWWYTLGDSDLA